MSERERMYPETSTFHFFNVNPHKRLGGDCVVRAICVFLDISWEQCVREMTELGIKKGVLLNDKSCINYYLESKGYKKMPMPRKDDNTRYTAKEFCQELADSSKKYILSLAGHETVVVNGKVNDIWDCTDSSVGNYWVR